MSYKIKIFLLFFPLILIFSGCNSNKSKNNVELKNLIKKLDKETSYIDSSSNENKAREFVVHGSSLQEQGRYAEAILDFFDALKYDSSASIFYFIAKNYKELYKYDNAKEYLIKSIKKDSTFVSSLELLAEISLLEFKIDDAVLIQRRLIELEPTRLNKLTLARMYEIKDKPKAIEIYEDLIKSGEDESILSRLSDLYQETDNESKYIQTLEKLYILSPSNVRGAIFLLDAYFKNKNFKTAFEFLDKISLTVPTTDLITIYSYISEAIIQDTSNSMKEYIPKFVDNINKNYKMEWRLNFLGGYLSDRIGNEVLTDTFFKRTLNLADTLADIPLQISMFYMQHKHTKRGIDILFKYPNFMQKNAKYPLFVSFGYSELDSNEKAIEYLRKGLSIDSNNIDIISQLGLIFDKQKNFDSSDYYYERALIIDPKNPLVNNNYSYSLSDRGLQLQRAYSMIQIAINREPNNISFLDTYGWVLYKLGHYDEAVTSILKAIEKNGANAEVYEHLGDIYNDMGKKNEAIASWKKALEIDKNRKSVIEKLK